jgi:hypothetical protein
MTVLVALETPRGVVLGTDSFIGNDAVRDVTAGPKWRRVGPLVIAFSGSMRLAQSLSLLKPPKQPRRGEDVCDWIVRTVVRPLVEANEWPKGTTSDLGLLVAYAGRCYEVGSDLGVSRSARGYAATGAGYPYALGALHASGASEPVRRVSAALAAACDLSPMCCGPLHVEVFA